MDGKYLHLFFDEKFTQKKCWNGIISTGGKNFAGMSSVIRKRKSSRQIECWNGITSTGGKTIRVSPELLPCRNSSVKRKIVFVEVYTKNVEMEVFQPSSKNLYLESLPEFLP